MQVRRNTTALEKMPQHAYEQILDSQMDRNNKRREIVARTNAAAQQGRINAALPPDAWESMDGSVYDAARDSLTLVQDLLDAGLRHPVDIRAKYDTWGIIDDTGEATVGMSPEAQEEESDVTVGDDGSPIPIIEDGYSIGFREEPMDSTRLPSNSLDTTKATVSGRHVSEAVESMFINAKNLQITGPNGEGYTLHGITDHPDTATGTTDADWTSDSSTVRTDIRAMRSILKNDRKYTPGNTGFWLYLGTEYYDTLDDPDSEGNGNMNIRDRVENLSNISRIREVDFLDEKSALMFRPTEDVIQVGVGANMQTVQWDGPFRDHWRAIASMYPRIKRIVSKPDVDSEYQNGFVYWTA